MKKAKMMLVAVAAVAVVGGAFAFKAKDNHFGALLYAGPNPAVSTNSATVEFISYKTTASSPITGYYTASFGVSATATVPVLTTVQ